MIRLWDVKTGVETARLEIDGAILCIAARPDSHINAGDNVWRLHWLETVDRHGRIQRPPPPIGFRRGYSKVLNGSKNAIIGSRLS
jgi:hypothetical protein